MHIGPNAEGILQISMAMPDDVHKHIRGNASDPHSRAIARTILMYTVPQWACIGRMPNRTPPDNNGRRIRQYDRFCGDELRFLNVRPRDFQSLRIFYLQDDTDPGMLEQLIIAGLVDAVKRYPLNATTGSTEGVSDLFRPNLIRIFKILEKYGIPFLSHSACTHETDGCEIDFYEWEIRDIPNLRRLRKICPNLKIIAEHASTFQMIRWVTEEYRAGRPTAATLTPHHASHTRNKLFEGGKMHPHFHMLPPLMPVDHMMAVRGAMVSGLPCFFCGTDDAGHDVLSKEAEPCSGGVCSVLNAIPAYVQIFENESALDKLENFMSVFAARFYGSKLFRGQWVPIIKKVAGRMLTIVKKPWTVPWRIPIVDGISYIVPYLAGKDMDWQVPAVMPLIAELV